MTKKNDISSHDHFVRKAMSRPKVAKEFFESYLPKEVLEKVDLTTLKKENSSFLSNTLGEGIVDVLYSVKFGEEEGYLSIILECQSTPDKLMTFRIQKYMLRLCDEYLKKHPKQQFPIIYPLIYYSGKKKYDAPRSFYELFKDERLAKNFFTEPVKVIDVNEIDDEELKKKHYAGVMMYLMHHIYEKEILPYIEEIAEIIKILAKEDRNYLEDMVYYILEKGNAKSEKEVISKIQEIVPKEFNIMGTIAEKLIQKGEVLGMQKGEVLGMQKGEVLGMQKGKLEVAKRMLEEGMKIKTISEITGIEIEQIKKSRTLN